MITRIALPLIALSLLLASCGESPNEPNDTTNKYTLDSPPPVGGKLLGSWKDSWSCTLSANGLYDPFYGMMNTEIRVSGNVVWYVAYGNGYKRLFCGVVTGDAIVGTHSVANWTASQGIVFQYPPTDFVYTKVK